MDENLNKWIEFLKPENLKNNLTFSSLYIAIYESFTDYVIEEIKSFYIRSFSDGTYIYVSDYKSKVLDLHKNPLTASLLWLKGCEAVNEEDLNKFESIRKERNKLAHELMELLFEGIPNTYPQNFIDLITLRIKIEKWWVMNIEIPTNSDFDNIDIKEDDIHTSSQLMYKIILDIISGDEKSSNSYYEEFMKHKREV